MSLENTMTQRTIYFKIIVVGDGGVGKSTMVQRLITGHFVPMKITIGTDLSTYDVQINENTLVRLQIWDFAGEKRFRFFLPNYSRGAYGCIFCYDLSRISSFLSLPEWYEIVSGISSEPVFILVGGKSDLASDRREVERSEAEEFQKEYNIDYFFETSSKSGENIKKIFETLTHAIIKKKGI